ncbi:hypothetical protein BsLM_1938 [Bacillus sp. LM 4-2]|nr:hypothetical protein BsLM_1938 [Bacillus sp. LM 4-2]
MLFEDAVLTDPAEEAFLTNFLLLEAGTALVLCLVFFLYQKLDQSQFAVIKLGIWGSAVGLLIDTISLWNLPSSSRLYQRAKFLRLRYGWYALTACICSFR